ncbi:MAG: LPS export ABC transporter periplasmic protein LptC [Acetobacteraceae bacterium]|nr:LPS export ABC transporter periplasmic protein LptC [Acetobacteraceae bacterium]
MTLGSATSAAPPIGTPDRRTGSHLMGGAAKRVRTTLTPSGLARRRVMITFTKWVLPVLALALLGTIAVWPELDRASDTARLAFRRVSGTVEGARLLDAKYHGVDERGRPYTVTAAVAQQVDAERINLTIPKGDITLENGSWLMVQSKQGVFMQHANQLDLSHEVTLYRDDGLTLTTASASVDLKNGAAASSDPTHAEGPFGTLDSQGFTVVDKGATVQFTGQSHVVLNGASP